MKPLKCRALHGALALAGVNSRISLIFSGCKWMLSIVKREQSAASCRRLMKREP